MSSRYIITIVEKSLYNPTILSFWTFVIIFSLHPFFFISTYAVNETDNVTPNMDIYSEESYTYNIEEYSSPLEELKQELKPSIYSPLVEVISSPPDYVTSKPVLISAHVLDKYSKIKNATLIYSVNNLHPWHKIRMHLIDGIPTNGTFSGTIPVQQENSTIQYLLYFQDYLNYSSFVVKDSIPDYLYTLRQLY